MTSTLLLGLVISSLEATIYLFYNDYVSDDFNPIARLNNLLVRSNHLSRNLDRNHKPDINEAREIYLTCKCYWNVAAYVNGKLRIRTLKCSLL